VKPVEIIHEMRRLLKDGSAWCKGSYARWEYPDPDNYDDGRPVGWCLVGAGLRAVGENVGSNCDKYDRADYIAQYEGLTEALAVITRITQEQFPDRLLEYQAFDGDRPLAVIPRFNDLDQTTWVEVDRVLDKAEVTLNETV